MSQSKFKPFGTLVGRLICQRPPAPLGSFCTSEVLCGRMEHLHFLLVPESCFV